MTEKELLKLEEQIVNKAQRSWRNNCASYDYFEEAYFDGYIACAKENGVVWHDLRKDPNDLPTPDNTSMSDYVITDRGVGYYNSRIKSWWVKNDCALTDKVIAWCEIPKFEEE